MRPVLFRRGLTSYELDSRRLRSDNPLAHLSYSWVVRDSRIRRLLYEYLSGIGFAQGRQSIHVENTYRRNQMVKCLRHLGYTPAVVPDLLRGGYKISQRMSTSQFKPVRPVKREEREMETGSKAKFGNYHLADKFRMQAKRKGLYCILRIKKDQFIVERVA